MTAVWNGGEVARALQEELRDRIVLLGQRGVVPRLAILRMGENDGDLSYERSAVKRCEALGISVERIALPAEAAESALLSAIERVNADASVHGCLLLRPLPKHIRDDVARNALLPEKDMDGVTDASLAGVFTGTSRGFAPCTAEACMQMLSHYGCDPKGKHAVVVGRSLVVGRPAAMLLLHKNATVTLCHTRTEALADVCRTADILLVAAGSANLIDAQCVREGQTVLDAGIHVGPDGRLCGDVRYADVAPIVAAVTPVPGGVGAVTTTVLARHVVEAAERTTI